MTAEYTLPETGFIRQKQLISSIVPFSRTTLWWMVKDGTFPAPVKLSSGVTAWRVEAVRAWLGPSVTLESAPAAITGRLTPDREVGQSAKQRSHPASVHRARQAPNKSLERELAAEAKAWGDATATRAYVSHPSSKMVRAMVRKPWPLISSFAMPIRHIAARIALSLIGLVNVRALGKT